MHWLLSLMRKQCERFGFLHKHDPGSSQILISKAKGRITKLPLLLLIDYLPRNMYAMVQNELDFDLQK